jgi:hypothetical protein
MAVREPWQIAGRSILTNEATSPTTMHRPGWRFHTISWAAYLAG